MTTKFESDEWDIALIDDLRARPAETEWFEFKENNTDPEMIGQRCSALSNSARLNEVEKAYLIWGIEDGTHSVVGTKFEPSTAKGKGNQDLEIWLRARLNRATDFSFRVVNHPDGRIVIMDIPATVTVPVEFSGTAYIRNGSATSRLSDFPERHHQLIDKIRPRLWEAGIALRFVSEVDVLQLLDFASYFRLTRQPLPDSPGRIIESLEGDRIVSGDVGGRFNITNLGAILFANDLRRFPDSIARKAVRLVVYEGNNKTSVVKSRIDGQKGYATGFEGLIDFVSSQLPSRERIGKALREKIILFPEIAIRELIANALIHQDMTITGAGPTISIFVDRIEITNPGKSLIERDRMIDLPPRSRNEAIASLMRRMRICEEEGSGLDKTINAIEEHHLPPLNLRQEEIATQAILYGPRSFAEMTPEERVQACYQHAVIKRLSGERLRNSSLCVRLGIDRGNAAQASNVIRQTTEAGLIKPADPEHPRAGYVPYWASS